MENQPQNPEFRINPENFYPCKYDFARPKRILLFSVSARLLSDSEKRNNHLDFFLPEPVIGLASDKVN